MTNAGARLKPIKVTMFTSFPDPKIQETSTEQVCQVLEAFFVVADYTGKDHFLLKLIN